MTLSDASILHGLDYLPALTSKGDGFGMPYTQWDANNVMICFCDYGYTGPDCSMSENIAHKKNVPS